MGARGATAGSHPAVAGYDFPNEPTPGSAEPEIFANIIGAFAAATGQDPQALAADFSDPQAKFSQLDHLNDEDVHRQIGDSLHPLVAAFETELVAPLMARVVSAVRQVDPHTLILREHNYFANLGIPSGQPPLEDSNWAYSPQRSADQCEDPGFATIALSGSSAPVLT